MYLAPLLAVTSLKFYQDLWCQTTTSVAGVRRCCLSDDILPVLIEHWLVSCDEQTDRQRQTDIGPQHIPR